MGREFQIDSSQKRKQNGKYIHEKKFNLTIIHRKWQWIQRHPFVPSKSTKASVWQQVIRGDRTEGFWTTAHGSRFHKLAPPCRENPGLPGRVCPGREGGVGARAWGACERPSEVRGAVRAGQWRLLATVWPGWRVCKMGVIIVPTVGIFLSKKNNYNKPSQSLHTRGNSRQQSPALCGVQRLHSILFLPRCFI